MKETIKNGIEKYQCPGCVCGSDITCFQPASNGVGCGKHVAGTRIYPGVGLIWLGMPKSFSRVGPLEHNIKIDMYESLDQLNQIVLADGYADNADRTQFYDLYNVPVWKYKKDGHVFVRGLMPRRNCPFVHIFLSEEGFDTIQCKELTEQDVKEMD